MRQVPEPHLRDLRTQACAHSRPRLTAAGSLPAVGTLPAVHRGPGRSPAGRKGPGRRVAGRMAAGRSSADRIVVARSPVGLHIDRGHGVTGKG